MAVRLQQDTIDAVADRIAAGQQAAAIQGALGLSRNSFAGIVSRLRKHGDPRVPAARAGAARTRGAEQDALADAFADGARDMGAAARVARLSIDTAHRRWAEICTMLGRQAS